LTGLDNLRLGTFAIVARSELDKIILWNSLLQFISSTVVVARNELTGPIPSELGGLMGLNDLLSLGKFAIVASSELDTIILLGSLSHNSSPLLLL
jgi:hypothetical protein